MATTQLQLSISRDFKAVTIALNSYTLDGNSIHLIRKARVENINSSPMTCDRCLHSIDVRRYSDHGDLVELFTVGVNI